MMGCFLACIFICIARAAFYFDVTGRCYRTSAYATRFDTVFDERAVHFKLAADTLTICVPELPLPAMTRARSE